MSLNKQQIIVIFGGLASVAGLYFLGPTVAPKKPGAETSATMPPANQQFQIETFESQSIKELSSDRQQLLTGLKASVKRGDVKDQEIHVDHRIAQFWKDSVPNPVLYFYYTGQAAELENSEKSLTFAAHSILGYLPYAQSGQQQAWLAEKGKELFDKAYAINPSNDSTIVGMGGTIIYGAGAGPEGTMQGIMKIREVAQRDSNNMFAQYMLGIGGLISRQYDKAVVRFEKVVQNQPNNLEALFKLAETNEQMDKKAEAIRWYEVIASKVSNEEMQAAIAARIKELKQ